ncbi:hypothetical protein RND81_02G032800 [Saponaria officinalis]|uniref:Uncharacterized protein n=1 Tax=Saponaria officinalis TaxID=3572 RepID=A0AAW1MMG2_SAPOF
MALARTLHQMLVIILGLSLLNRLNAIPITRSKNLMHEYSTSFQPSMKSHHENREGRMKGRRLEVEIEDYAGSGANNRHTPRASQFGGVCVDC